MAKFFQFIVIFGLSFLLTIKISASETDLVPAQRMWVNAGYIENAQDVFGGRLAYTYYFKPLTITGRLTGMGAADRDYPAVYPPPDDSWDLNYILDFSVLGGIALIHDYGGFSFSGGVGYYRGEEENRFDYRSFQTIGFPIEAQIFITPVNGFGLSLVWDTNFTSVSRHSSLFLGLQIGPMR